MTTQDAAEAVTAAGRRWWAGVMAGDASVIDELFSDDVIYFHSGALPATKAGYRARVADGTYRDLTIEYAPEQVTVLGDVVLVAAKIISSGRVSAYTHDKVVVQALSVWNQRDGHWQLVGHTMTPVKDPAELYARATSD